MSINYRLSHAFDFVPRLPLNSQSKYVIFSDCHRGNGCNNDNFIKNEFLYRAALKHYFRSGFTYLELGDGDDLWETRFFCDIFSMHQEVFQMLDSFYCDRRFYSVYGNHDIIKKYCSYTQKYNLPDSYSGIILKNTEYPMDIYLTHGHQVDLLNSVFWPVSRFLVRHVWRPLEAFGILDPTCAPKNNLRKRTKEKKLMNWAKQNHCILITGHTHHPMMGTPESPYFNSGSCVSPTSITCIEVKDLQISLVKWSVGTLNDLTLHVQRTVLGIPIHMKDFFSVKSSRTR